MIGFIVNPASGNGYGGKIWRELEAILEERSISYAVRLTTGQGEALLFAEEWATDDQITLIATVGGDGTVHEAANGIFKAQSSMPLGYIPAGSGNDFARGHHIPLNPIQALELLIGEH